MSFAKFVVSLALLAPLASALTVLTPTGWTSAASVTIQWQAANGDPQTFSIELFNEAFNDQFALVNNAPTGAMELNVTLPQVPARDGYTIQFIDISNATDVLAESAPFSIGAEVSSSTSSTATDSASASQLSSASSTSAAGTTTSAGSTAGATTGTGTNTGSAAVGESTSFDSGAIAVGVSNTNLASFGLMAVVALAGARFVGF